MKTRKSKLLNTKQARSQKASNLKFRICNLFGVSNLEFRNSKQGILLIEVLLAVAVFSMITLVVLSAFTYGREATSNAGDNSRAAQISNTAVEALHNIAQSSYSNLDSYTNGTTYYLSASGSQWAISSSPTTINTIFTPSLVFANGPNNSRQVTVTVRWPINARRTGQVTTTTYLSNWQVATSATIKTGLLVYANGGTTTSLITYRFLQSNGLWTTPQSLPSVGASNRVARSVKLYSAQTGTKKVVMARFYDGSRQYLYGFPWSGNAWSTPQLLDSWTSSSALDSGNFSGTWLANGTFMAIYSDNTSTPRYNTFDGTNWSGQSSLPSVGSGDIPTSMIVRARPGTNEAMLALLDDNAQTYTSYYANGSWSGYTTQASTGTSGGTHNVDFDWSEANGGIYGALVYTRGTTDRTPSVRVWTANGSGSGSWGSVMTSTNQPSGSIVTSVTIAGQPSGSAVFILCDKDSASTQKVYCYTATPTTISVPTNNVLSSNAASGGQQSMELGFEDTVGTTGLSAYAEESTSAKLKKFNSATNTWDASPLSAPTAASNIDKTRLIPEPGQNDAMVLQIDSQNNLYSIMYNGNGAAFYTLPTGYAWTIHNANGPSTSAKWFDFGWDN